MNSPGPQGRLAIPGLAIDLGGQQQRLDRVRDGVVVEGIVDPVVAAGMLPRPIVRVAGRLDGILGRVRELAEALRPGAVGKLGLHGGFQGKLAGLVDPLIPEFQRLVQSSQKSHGRLRFIVVEGGPVERPFARRRTHAVVVTGAGLGRKFDRGSPAAAAELALDQAFARRLRRLQQIRFAGSPVGVQIGQAYGRRSRRLDPDVSGPVLPSPSRLARSAL